MAKDRKKSMRAAIAGALAVLAGLAMLGAGVYMYLDAHVKIEPRKFDKYREIAASQSYERIMGMDFENAYPSSPEAVVDFFNETFQLMYSESIVNDGTLLEVLAQQRKVYSAELQQMNPEELQFAQLKDALESLYEGGNICQGAERKGTVYDDLYPGECVIQTEIFYNTFGSVYRNYYLIRDSGGNWRVNAWKATDENYTDER